jgi:catechol 2,3-dioxygenase-like lactoylglutathione lyase family enzyme
VFDHVAIAVSDLAASERFYGAVLGVLGAEPSHADAELVEWEDWDIGVTDREHPVTRRPTSASAPVTARPLLADSSASELGSGVTAWTVFFAVEIRTSDPSASSQTEPSQTVATNGPYFPVGPVGMSMRASTSRE